MKTFRKYYKPILFLIPIISLALHFHVFSMDLIGIHVWRQTETQTVINNFYTEDFNILNPRYNQCADTDRLHRMEFPLMQWIFALFYKLFGAHIIIFRILSFIIGLWSVCGMYYLCDSIFKNKTIATLCAWCFNFSPVFYYYTLNPMPDNLALCFGIWSLHFFYKYINTEKISYAGWSALLLCLATLTKLPFIIYGSFILTFTVSSLIRKEYFEKEQLKIILIYMAAIIPPAIWYGAVIPDWHNVVVKGIFGEKVSLLFFIDILSGTIISKLPELVINYGSVLFFICGIYFIYKNKLYQNQYFLLFLFWGATIILYSLYELNAIQLIHDYYLFPFLPGIFLLVAYGAFCLLSAKTAFFRTLALICFAILPLTAFLRIDSRWSTAEPGFEASYYKYKNELRSLTPKNAYCIAGNDISHYILLYYIDRKGWAFHDDALDEQQLCYYISKGARYLFVDSHMDEKPEIKAHLGEKIFDKERLRVYKLK